MALLEALNIIGIESTVFLQTNLPVSAFSYATKTLQYMDPSFIISLYFPIISAISLGTGFQMVSALIYCDLLVMILHWAVGSERPFWWLHESAHYLKQKKFPQLSQFPTTCETGPATPCAVTALNAAAFFIISKSIISILSNGLRKHNKEKLIGRVSNIVWICYGSLMALEMSSHVYLASHFPYQCVLGVIIGIGAALYATNERQSAMKNKKISYSTLLVFLSVGLATALGSIYSEVYSQSILKAIRWCVKREFIVINPTPLYPVSRLIGLSLGLTFSKMLAAKCHQKDFERFSWKMKLSFVILSLSAGQTAFFTFQLFFGLPIWLYYTCVCILNASVVYVILYFLPSFIMKACGVKSVKLQPIIINTS